MPTQTPVEPHLPIEPAAPPKIHRVEVEWHAVTYKTVIIYGLLAAAIVLAGMFIVFPMKPPMATEDPEMLKSKAGAETAAMKLPPPETVTLG